jgi:hypothetical protein
MTDPKDQPKKNLAPGIDPKWGVTVEELNYSTKNEKKQYPNLYETFEPAAQAVDDKTSSLSDKDFDHPILIRTTPGIGKTESGIHLATRYAKQGKVVFYALPTRDMCWQIQERFKSGYYGQGHKVIVFDGRHDGYIRTRINDKGFKDEIKIFSNCQNYEKVTRCATKGFPPGAFVCPSCPMWPHHKNEYGDKTGISGACAYYQTLYKAAGIPNKVDTYGWAPIVLVTHQMLASIVADSNMVKPEVIIVDEDWRSALREVFSWPEQELKRQIKNAPELAEFRKLLAKSIEVAAKYKKQAEFPLGPDAEKDKTEIGKLIRDGIKNSKIFGSYGIWGINLANIVKAAAAELGVDYIQVIEAASIADTGINRGEYMYMGDYKEMFVPHYKDCDLASELLLIIEAANNNDQFAYRVSLRWDDKEGWGYYWDYVRRSHFGGPSIFLDAYGSELLTQRVCDRADPKDVEVIDVHCKVRSNVEVFSYGLAKTSRGAMESNREELFEYVDFHLRKSRGLKTLIYIPKCYVEWLKQKIKQGNYGLASCMIKWFWQDRGDDNFGDYDTLIVFGSAYSNVVAERHFANAMFYGEKPLDWSTSPDHIPVDERVCAHLEARQQKEMLQAAFRVRPSKPRDKKQTIVFVSAMKLDLQYEFPGAKIYFHKGPLIDADEVMKSVWNITKMVGGWTELFSAFILKEQQLKEWLDAGGVKSGQDFFLTYEEIVRDMRRWFSNPTYRASKGMLVSGPGYTFKMAAYRKKLIWMCGDEAKVKALLDQVRIATREPGVDDDAEDEGVDESSEQIKKSDQLPVEKAGKPRHVPDPDHTDGCDEEFDEMTQKAFVMASDEFMIKDPSGNMIETHAFVLRIREIYRSLQRAAKTGPLGTDGSTGPPDG